MDGGGEGIRICSGRTTRIRAAVAAPPRPAVHIWESKRPRVTQRAAGNTLTSASVSSPLFCHFIYLPLLLPPPVYSHFPIPSGASQAVCCTGCLAMPGMQACLAGLTTQPPRRTPGPSPSGFRGENLNTSQIRTPSVVPCIAHAGQEGRGGDLEGEEGVEVNLLALQYAALRLLSGLRVFHPHDCFPPSWNTICYMISLFNADVK